MNAVLPFSVSSLRLRNVPLRSIFLAGRLRNMSWKRFWKPEFHQGVGALVEIRKTSSGFGVGVFAKVSIPYSSVLLRIPPSSSFKKDINSQHPYPGFWESPGMPQRKVLQSSMPQEAALPIMFTLAGLPQDAKSSNHSPWATLHINHSCIPNSDSAYIDKSNRQLIIANRDIGAGEEITVSYTDPTRVRDVRRADLWRHGFQCRCTACDFRYLESRARERHLKNLNYDRQHYCLDSAGRLIQDVIRSPNNLELVATRVQKCIKWLTLHNSLRKYLWQPYLTASEIALARYKLTQQDVHLEFAIKMLDYVIELDVLYYGDDSHVTESHRRLWIELKQGNF